MIDLPEDAPRLADWTIRLERGSAPVIYSYSSGEDLATIHGSGDVALSRALLMARAPALRDAVRAAIKVFAAMREYGNERERAVAGDMLPSMDAALQGLDSPGQP